MRIYNLTDRTMGVSPQTVKVCGVKVPPGESVEIPPVHPSKTAGLVAANMISIDKIPEWYTASVKRPEPTPVPEPVPAPTEGRGKRKKWRPEGSRDDETTE